jgi:plasmid maintenance system antidote protein VapI
MAAPCGRISGVEIVAIIEKGKRSISAPVPRCAEDIGSVPHHVWLNLQSAYD